jgi:quercetin dioxygenase-like cupin family protein
MHDRDGGMSTEPDTKHVPALLPCQSGAIVSRVIMKAEGGSLTAFALAEGEGLSEHTTPFDAVVVALEGEGQVRIAGREHVLRVGEAVTMPAHQPHAVRAVSDFKMLLVMFRR